MNMTHPLPISERSVVSGRDGGETTAPTPRQPALEPAPPAGKLLFGGNEGDAALRDPWWARRAVTPDTRVHRRTGAPLPLVDYHRDHPAARAFDLLRTQMVRTLEQNGWNRVAIAAPTSGCGSTFTAVNLALSMGRVPGSRTVLMDLDQRAPGVSGALGMGGSHDVGAFLSGVVTVQRHMVRIGETLALGLNTRINRNASEQMHDMVSGLVLEEMQDMLDPDVVIYDLPAMLEYDDLAAFLPQVDGVLLVADGTRTSAGQIAECERLLSEQTRLLGVILNRGRAGAI